METKIVLSWLAWIFQQLFDTINHQMHTDRLEAQYGITESALSWFQSYLSNRFQYIKLYSNISSSFTLSTGPAEPPQI
ncbi:hypothetical protein HELRODRAFT_69217 [Helobdella robusta]|uniref:Uncharacterized protein n=1 Tax=Helobdella robusta TaxID=6412 RepID=T1FZR1_HELRO|nr:hypothetical protein HELRODRAFT_69217 [Helobdella robusta]ESN92879.1 hypothetical protein HELRODRAFT_69217 [Helobdella robusta]